MAQITINHENFEHTTNSETTINEVLDQILHQFAGKEKVVTNIHINGECLSVENEHEFLEKPAASFNEIDFTVISSLDLAYEALDDCAGYIDNVIEKIAQLTVLYTENKAAEANQMFTEVVEIMDLFVQLMTKIHSTIRRQHPERLQANKTLQALEIHLLSIMRALLPAKEKEDIIMLCDLLEYELVDNLTQWKIQAIPALKKVSDS
jgi:hypothetical protein